MIIGETSHLTSSGCFSLQFHLLFSPPPPPPLVLLLLQTTSATAATAVLMGEMTTCPNSGVTRSDTERVQVANRKTKHARKDCMHTLNQLSRVYTHSTTCGLRLVGCGFDPPARSKPKTQHCSHRPPLANKRDASATVEKRRDYCMYRVRKAQCAMCSHI